MLLEGGQDRSLFLHHEVDVILQIPLNPFWPEDKIIWSFTSNGAYTVKSVYKIGMTFIKNVSPTEGPSNLH